jgi:hypothetical protein
MPTNKSTRDNNATAHHYSPEDGGSILLQNAGLFTYRSASKMRQNVFVFQNVAAHRL